MEPIVVEPALGTLEWKETNLKKQLSKKIKYILITFDEGQPAAVEPVLEWCIRRFGHAITKDQKPLPNPAEGEECV